MSTQRWRMLPEDAQGQILQNVLFQPSSLPAPTSRSQVV